MINLIGKWKAAEMIDFNAEKGTMDWTKVEDILAKDDLDKDTRFMANMVVVFGERHDVHGRTALEGRRWQEYDRYGPRRRIAGREGWPVGGSQRNR